MALRRWWIGLALAAAQPAIAQTTMLEPSAAVQCLTHGSEPLVYPPELFERRDAATIEVELSFTAPDAAPRVKWLTKEPNDGRFETAIRSHVRQFRVPCMRPQDSPVTLRQVYVFTPNDGRRVAVSQPTDERALERRAKLACMTHVLKIKQPDYPDDARREDAQGPVIVNLRFTQPDVRPEIRVLASSHKYLRREIETYVAGLRLPCLDADEISINQIYQFRLVGGERTVFKDSTLAKLLGSVRNPPTPAFFDFDAMSCPFDVRFEYFQPYLSNTVRELEASNSARRPLLDWLSRLTLNLDEKTNLRVIGQQMNVSVPCGKLDL
jgi:hypothetical protein